MGKFDEKVVIVTGASLGVGAATALAFAKEGASLAIQGRNQERLNDTAAKCKEAGAPKVITIIAELTDLESAERIIQKTVESYKSIDILVNNAAVQAMGRISDLDLATYEKITTTNIRAPVFLCKHALPHLKKTKGCVINVSSAFGVLVEPASIIYSMTKCALDHFTRGFAAECASFGVRVNSINPGAVDTGVVIDIPDQAKDLGAKVWKKICENQKLGIIQPSVIAESILFLCGSSHITGTSLLVDGALNLPN